MFKFKGQEIRLLNVCVCVWVYITFLPFFPEIIEHLRGIYFYPDPGLHCMDPGHTHLVTNNPYTSEGEGGVMYITFLPFFSEFIERLRKMLTAPFQRIER